MTYLWFEWWKICGFISRWITWLNNVILFYLSKIGIDVNYGVRRIFGVYIGRGLCICYGGEFEIGDCGEVLLDVGGGSRDGISFSKYYKGGLNLIIYVGVGVGVNISIGTEVFSFL